MPTAFCLLCKAEDGAKAERIDDQTILVSHQRVRSLLDAECKEFSVQALGTLDDMFEYNMKDKKARYIVGRVRFASGAPVLMASRIFALLENVSEKQAMEWMQKEITMVSQLPGRQGAKRPASALMEETPAKKPWKALE